MFRPIITACVVLAACKPSEPPMLIDVSQNETTMVGRSPPLPVEAVRKAARAEANRRYGKDCGTVTIPDTAFAPVEVTRGGDPEYAVFFGRARCDANGAMTWFSGTGGAQIELW